MVGYSYHETGARRSSYYQGFFIGVLGPLSPIHDIPLFADESKKNLHMVVEIPRWSNAKMEITKNEILNPIKQNCEDNRLRYIYNIFPYKGVIWNYGAFPQTWADPSSMEVSTSYPGDNDMLDVCEIGSKVYPTGTVIVVKPLGILGVIDQGVTDWKVIAIDVSDPLASKLITIDDVEQYLPGLLKATRNWFRVYKIPEGKNPNCFGFSGQIRDKEIAYQIIHKSHNSWRALIGGAIKGSGIKLTNVTVPFSPFRISPEESKLIVHNAGPLCDVAYEEDSIVQVWHHITV